MLNQPTIEELRLLLQALVQMPHETEWVEFKANPDREKLGKYISALSNSAALLEKECGYIVYGVDDKTHEIVGTHVHFSGATHKQQEVESWLQQKLSPKTEFQPYEFSTAEGIPVILIQIPAAANTPVKFDGDEWIRVGSTTKRLQDFPEKERKLWRSFDNKSFESRIAAKSLNGDQVFNLLCDCSPSDLTTNRARPPASSTLPRQSLRSYASPQASARDVTSARRSAQPPSNFECLPV